jgi:hypothetical protein
MARQLPCALDPLNVLNGGDSRAIDELLKLGGLKGKTLEKVLEQIPAGRPYASLAEVSKRTKGLSADCLLNCVEQWLAFSRNQPAAVRKVPHVTPDRSLEMA